MLVDINGTFLWEKCKDGDPDIYIDIPKGMQKWYTEPPETVLQS